MGEPRGSFDVVRNKNMVREPCETNHVGEPKNDKQPIRTEPCEPKLFFSKMRTMVRKLVLLVRLNYIPNNLKF